MKIMDYVRTIIEENNHKGGFIHPLSMIKEKCVFDFPIHLSKATEVHSSCKIGKYSFINSYTVLYSKVEVGNYCTFARNCEIGMADHLINWLSSNSFQYSNDIFPILKDIDITKSQFVSHKKTVIGNDVWGGVKVCIINGVNIGTGAIIAAGAVVTKNVEPYSIVGRVSARMIRKRFSNKHIKLLLELEWWKLNPHALNNIKFNNIDLAIKQLKERL